MKKAEKSFWVEFNEAKDALEHIPDAISGSEIETDLNFLEEKIKNMKKLKKVM